MSVAGFVSTFTGTALSSRTRCDGSALSPAKTSKRMHMSISKREARRSIIKSDNFNRSGFKESREEAKGLMNREFTSDLVKELLAHSNIVSRGKVTVKLAKAYGFCWGVERAIAIAYEARAKFPDRRIWITNEIIHNPIVNQRMKEIGIYSVPQEGLQKDLSGIEQGDVVVLPAFGATLEEMKYINDLGVEIVDTTCPWVSKVWHALDRHQKKECTSIIHGKWKHEETIATASFAEKYLVVLNMDEAEYVANYILNGGDKAEFLAKFENAKSEGFDPDTDLNAVGVANQTTMLKSETTAVAKLFEKVMLRKFGPTDLNSHFVAYDTICNATQERQDAMYDLLAEKESLDLMLVVGGFNSSNTSHLQEIAEHAGVPSFWVDRPERVGPGNRIYCRSASGEERLVEDWLPEREITVGLTSGASTPDNVVEDVLERVFMISKLAEAKVLA